MGHQRVYVRVYVYLGYRLHGTYYMLHVAGGRLRIVYCTSLVTFHIVHVHIHMLYRLYVRLYIYIDTYTYTYIHIYVHVTCCMA